MKNLNKFFLKILDILYVNILIQKVSKSIQIFIIFNTPKKSYINIMNLFICVKYDKNVPEGFISIPRNIRNYLNIEIGSVVFTKFYPSLHNVKKIVNIEITKKPEDITEDDFGANLIKRFKNIVMCSDVEYYYIINNRKYLFKILDHNFNKYTFISGVIIGKMIDKEINNNTFYIEI
jgi:hypothetical protein